MSNVKVCFNSNTYSRALKDLERAGFDVGSEKASLSGSYWCTDDVWDALIDPNSKPRGVASGVWIDNSGRVYSLISLDDLPKGVRAAVGVALTDITPLEKMMYDSLAEFYQCEKNGSQACVSKVLNNAIAGRQKIKEEEEKQAKLAAEAKVTQEKQAIESAIQRADLLWEKAVTLLKLSHEQDKGPGGICYGDLEKIYNNYAKKKTTWRPATLEEASRYEKLSRYLFAEMARDSSGYKTIKERGGDIGCNVSEWTGSKPYCDYGYDPYASYGLNINCSSFGVSESVTLSSGGCSKPAKTEKTYRDWK